MANSTGGTKTATIELEVVQVRLPTTPDFVMKCCIAQGVAPKCRGPCNFSLDDREFAGECEHEASKLLFCAKDGIDHRECCVEQGVPRECLPFCDRSNDVADNERAPIVVASCVRHAQLIMSCFYRSHRK